MSIDVLKAVSYAGELGTTQIMYKANMSWGLLQPILKSLVEQGLLTRRQTFKSRYVYQITEKGIETLYTSRKTKDNLGE